MNGFYFKVIESECVRECIVSVVYVRTLSLYLALYQKIDKGIHTMFYVKMQLRYLCLQYSKCFILIGFLIINQLSI